MNRLRSLDGLRGLAALGVVLWHWRHFFTLDSADPSGWHTAAEPFFLLLKPFYLLGWAAVDVFFVLSGFVFFWLYGDMIRSRAIGAMLFARLRFSRLYPLHVATLISVAFLQMLFFRDHRAFFIYDNNDWLHFVAQLFMVQSWPPNAPQTFNGPAWSVSVEVLMYAIFFLGCRSGLSRGLHCFVVAIVGGLLFPLAPDMARGLIGFFMGGVAFALWNGWKNRPVTARVANLIGLTVLAGWALLVFLIFKRAAWFGSQLTLFVLVFDFVLCPLTVLALALRENVRGTAHPALAFLGDISYASYLLHFPLQLVLVLAAGPMGWNAGFFMQGWVLIAFFAVLIALSALIHHYFEKPLQGLLRGGGSAARGAAAANSLLARQQVEHGCAQGSRIG